MIEIFNETIRDRFRSPIISNFIVSWLTWNWKIPYVTIFVDKTGLKGYPNKIDYIVDEIICHYDGLCAFSCLCKFSAVWQLIFLPLLSTIFMVTLYQWLLFWAKYLPQKFRSKWITISNKLKEIETVPKTDHNKVKRDLNLKEDEIDNIKSILITKNKELEIKTDEIQELEKKYKELNEENNKILSELYNKNKSIQELENSLGYFKPTIEEIFNGIYHLVYKFDVETAQFVSGEEYFRIINGVEYFTRRNNDVYSKRANIKDYQFKKKIEGFVDREYDSITFTKLFFDINNNFNFKEFAICTYYLHTEESISGSEIYTNDGGITYVNSKITISKHPVYKLKIPD